MNASFLRWTLSSAVTVLLSCPSLSSGQELTCVAPENAAGSIDWPAPCPYHAKRGTNRVIADAISLRVNGLPPGEPVVREIVLPPGTYTRGPGGNLGGEIVGWDGELRIVLVHPHTGAVLDRVLAMSAEVHTGRSTAPGADTQSFDTEMVSLSAALFGDPDFDQLRVRQANAGGASHGGKGRTSLRRLPTGNFNVDSSFDASFEIEFTGAGPDWGGVTISGTLPVRLQQTLRVVNGISYEPLPGTVLTRTEQDLTIGGDGSSEDFGLRCHVPGGGLADALTIGIDGFGGPTLEDGSLLRVDAYPPPQRVGEPGIPPAQVSTFNAGFVETVCNWGDVAASDTVVEVWDRDTLVAVGEVPDGAPCYTVPSAGFVPTEVRAGTLHQPTSGQTGATRRRSPSFSTTFGNPTEVTIAGVPGPLVGTRVICTAKNAGQVPNGISTLQLSGKCEPFDWDNLCIVICAAHRGLEHSGLGKSALAIEESGNLVVSNIGSSGADGVSVAISGDGDCDDCLPYRASLSPLDVENAGGTFIVSSLDGAGNNVATAEYRGGGGAGGSIWVDFNTASPVCQVSVFNDGLFVGAFDVAITAGVLGEVAAVDNAADGSPLLTGCGKRRIGWPWELSCLVEEFDRDVTITPTGGQPLVGDEVRLLAPGATEAEVRSIRSIQMRAADVPAFSLCGEESGPDLNPAPLIPPSDFPTFEYPGDHNELVKASNSYFRWDPATGQAVCVNSKLTNCTKVAEQGSRKTYDATLELHIEGVGGLVYSRTVALAGSFVIDLAPNQFAGHDVQQFKTSMRDFDFELPAGDLDFDTLRLSGGGDTGVPNEGDVIIRKIPECVFEIEGLEEILVLLEMTGAQGGPLAGGAVSAEYGGTWVLTQPGTAVDGVPVRPAGGADLTLSREGQLVVSNIGSSGIDGVRFALPDAEGCSVDFDQATGLSLDPGGSLRFEEFGTVRGLPAGASLGTATCTNQINAFYNITYDFSSISPSSTLIQVYDRGAFVGEIPVAAARGGALFVPAAGQGLPAFKGCGKLAGLGAPPCKRIKWCFPGTIDIPGQLPLVGDEVRLLALGVAYDSLSTFDLRLAGVSDEPVLLDLVTTKFGRDLTGEGGAVITRANNHNTTRSNKTQALAVSNIGSSGQDGVRFVPPPVSAASGLPTGKRQHKPLNISTPDLEMGNFGAGLQLEATGTVGGKPATSFGKLNFASDGTGTVAVRPNFGGRGGGIIRLRVYSDPNQEGENPLSGGSLVSETTGQSGQPVCYLKYKLERVFVKSWSAGPAFGNEPDRYSCVLSSGTDVELPDGTAIPCALRIEVAILDPEFPAEDLESFTLRGQNLKPFTIDSVFTGPVYPHGLPHLSVGSAQIAQDPSGQLVVSNIGSSGDDGVSIDLGHAEGAAVTPAAPIEIQEGELLSVGIRRGGLRGPPGTFDTEILSMDLTGMAPGGGGGGSVPVRLTHQGRLLDTGGQPLRLRLQGFDDTGALTGDVLLDGGVLGDLTSSTGNVKVRIIDVVTTTITFTGLEAAPPPGPVGPSLALEFSEPATFAPSDGGPRFIACRCRLSIYCGPGQIYCPDGHCATSAAGCFPVATDLVLQTTDDPLVLDQIEVLKFGHPFRANGGGRIWPRPGYLRVSNIGSSGDDGVWIDLDRTSPGGRASIGPITMRPIRMEIGAQAPAGTDIPSLELEALQPDESSLGTAEIEFVEVAGELGPALRADFNALGTGEVLVQVCLDGQCVGEYVAAGGEVGRIRRASVAQPSLVSTGGSGTTGVPGGELPPGYCFGFDRPVALIPPGADPDTGAIIGNEICVRAHRTLVTVQTLFRFGIAASNLPEFAITDIADRSFSDFLFEHFSFVEVEELIAANFDIDHDKDGANAIIEHGTGGHPFVSDYGLSRRPASSQGAGADGLPRLRHSYVLAPVSDVHVRMRSAEDLQNWNEDPSQFTLVGRQVLPDGSTRLTWELNEPIGGTNGDKYQVQMGPIYVLQPATP